MPGSGTCGRAAFQTECRSGEERGRGVHLRDGTRDFHARAPDEGCPPRRAVPEERPRLAGQSYARCIADGQNARAGQALELVNSSVPDKTVVPPL